jgi:hypothetical protein
MDMQAGDVINACAFCMYRPCTDKLYVYDSVHQNDVLTFHGECSSEEVKKGFSHFTSFLFYYLFILEKPV